MDNVKAIGGGIAGGAACLVLWLAIAFFGGVELGIFVILVGAAVGLGVRLLAKPHQGVEYGALAVLIALGTILLGKLAATAIVTESMKQSALAQKIDFTDDQMMMRAAEPITSQRIRVGAPMQWRNGKSLLTAESINDYPADIAQQATDKWNQVTDKDRAKIDAAEKEKSLKFGQVNTLRQNAVSESFGILNLLWIIVALPAAFFLGAGNLSSEDEEKELDGGNAKWDGDTLKAADADSH